MKQYTTRLSRKKLLLFGFFTAAILFGSFLLAGEWGKGRALPHQEKTTILSPIKSADVLTYTGVTGKSALVLLKEHAHIEIAPSGLVTTINGRKAEDSKHEYWAFLVNGKLADVGPGEYQTKDTDTIEWKVSTY